MELANMTSPPWPWVEDREQEPPRWNRSFRLSRTSRLTCPEFQQRRQPLGERYGEFPLLTGHSFWDMGRYPLLPRSHRLYNLPQACLIKA
jgi:hypothetical protein